MEPSVRACSHGGAGGLALVPGHALGHVGHRAVHCDQGAVRHGGLGQLTGVHCNRFLVDRLEGGHVDVNGEGDNGPPALGILLVSVCLHSIEVHAAAVLQV